MVRLHPSAVLVCTLFFTSLTWAAGANPQLPRARLLLSDLRYAEAARALDDARALPGNDRDTLLEILELQGVVAGMLQQPDKARTAFQTLLVLAPDYRLKGDYAPRVVTPFFEAKAWVSDQRAALTLGAVPGGAADPSPRPPRVQSKDTLKLGRSVRFHLRVPGAGWRVEERPLVEGQAAAGMAGERVEWWAELLGEQQAVLVSLGSEAEPLVTAVPGAQALAPPALPPTQEPRVTSGPTSPLRILGYVGLGLAVGTGAAGGYFGVQSREARARVEGATVDEGGVTTGLTQKEAYALDERARSQAGLANVLFGVAGAAAIAGGTLWVLGAPVTVSATPTGVVVGGVLP